MKKKVLNLIIALFLVVVAGISAQNFGNSGDKGDEYLLSPIKLDKVTVSKHVDGDTVYVRLQDGTEKKVRFIGVNCPESTNRTDPYGKEASNFTMQKLLGRTIYLEKDVSETDRYGRLLRYLWLEPPKEVTEDEIKDKQFNAILVLEGYAQVSTYPPDVKYSKLFVQFQREAKESNKGLWALKKE